MLRGDTPPLPEFVFVRAPAKEEASPLPSPADRYIDGCQIVRFSPKAPAAKPVLLTKGFVSARDPSVSFDGRHIMFAGRRTEAERWQVWRMDSDGKNIVRITRGPADSVSPVYAGSIFHLDDKRPTPRIVYAKVERGKLAGGGEPVFALYSADLDGGNERRITFNLFSDFDPGMLDNGRIVFSSRRPGGARKGIPGPTALMAVNIDGTDLMAFAEGAGALGRQETARASRSGGRLYYIESGGPADREGGDLAFVSLRRPLHSRSVLAAGQKGMFLNPCPLADNRLLASYRPDGGDFFGIYEIDPESGRTIGPIYAEKGFHCLDAHALVPRSPVRGRSSVVGFGHTDSGVFYCLSVYTGGAPELRGLPRGAVREVRVLEGLPGTMRILGVAPVEEDGSFQIRVPARTPLSFQLLDERGMSLLGQRSWTWVMPGESRGCISCHEDREMAPPNRLAAAIVKPETRLLSPEKERRFVDFLQEIAPVLKSRCMNCHDYGMRRPLLAGDPFSVYKTLADGRYVTPGSARRSPLIARLMGTSVTPVPCAAVLSDSLRVLFVEWTDLGAAYDARPPKEGAR
jgi:hypothetical protein